MLILLMINIPAYIGVGSLFFKSWQDFRQSLLSIYKNRNDFSLLGWEDFSESWHSMKGFIYILCCLGMVLCEVQFFNQYHR